MMVYGNRTCLATSLPVATPCEYRYFNTRDATRFSVRSVCSNEVGGVGTKRSVNFGAGAGGGVADDFAALTGGGVGVADTGGIEDWGPTTISFLGWFGLGRFPLIESLPVIEFFTPF